MKNISVFCGSSSGQDKTFYDEAFSLGAVLATKGITVVYGGARIGLMGAVADGALRAGGEVIGVLPRFLMNKEIAHDGLTDLILVNSMHERKMQMHELSDSAIALAGGFGTLEELFELLTWGHLGLHTKPVGLLNIKGFYDPLVQMLQRMVIEGLLKESNREMLLIADNAQELLGKMEAYQPPLVPKWISPDKT